METLQMEVIQSVMARIDNKLRYLWITLAVLSATSGLAFLSQSSFFKLQFEDGTPTAEALFFGALSAVLVFLVFMAPNWSDVLRKVWNARLTLDCVFMGIVWALAFLIKYPRFDVNSKYRKSCVFFKQRGNKTPRSGAYGLFAFGAFALLALLLSSERQKTVDLGFFSILVGLIMDTSLEITTIENGPVLGYILGSAVYCVVLILLKHYMEHSVGNRDESKRRGLGREVYRNGLVFFSALVGTVCLFLSPFSEQQFEDSTNLKAVCFITFSFLLGYSLLKARESIDALVTKCHERFLVKAAVKTCLFAVVSVVIFMTKYPRFRVHSKNGQSCDEKSGKKIISQRNRFDVYSTGSFSLFALTLSSYREQAVRLGFFSFLVGLTMDASIEMLGNENPSFVYVVFASLYCGLLILVKSYLDSLVEKKEDSAMSIEISEVPKGRDRSFQEEQPLIEINAGEECDLEIGEIGNDFREEDSDGGNEPWTGVVNGAPSHVKHGAQLLNRRERHRVRRKEKAKRERERMKEKRNQKEDLWNYVV